MNYIDAANQSAVNLGKNGTSAPELYEELWWYSGSYSSWSNTSGTFYLQKGSTSPYGGTTSSAIQLFTLNPSSDPNTKYALEIGVLLGSISLYDLTSSAVVSGSSITGLGGTYMSILRSSQFTLTPGHSYAVQLKVSSGTGQVTDASLIVFPS